MTLASSPSAAAPSAAIEGPPRTMQPEPDSLDLTVFVQGVDSGTRLSLLLPPLVAQLRALGVKYELCLLAPRADPATRATALAHGARVVDVPAGYGAALITGLAQAAGKYIMTMDADLSHPPEVAAQLWAGRDRADLTIASRYVPGAVAEMGVGRRFCSRVLNGLFSRGLDLPIRDMSSGFRLYRAGAIRELRITSRNYDILQQILVDAFAEGWRVREVPFRYRSSRTWASDHRLLPMGWAWLRTFGELWKLRNSILSADYDDRSHDSRIPLQRYWQRMRHRHVMDLVAGEGPVLDVGCGFF